VIFIQKKQLIIDTGRGEREIERGGGREGGKVTEKP
jgi:hypothetical protein